MLPWGMALSSCPLMYSSARYPPYLTWPAAGTARASAAAAAAMRATTAFGVFMGAP
jgi:hypothetical protein